MQQPYLLRSWDDDRVLSRRRAWLARLLTLVLFGSTLSSVEAGSASELIGGLLGVSLVAVAILGLLYRALSRQATAEELDTLTTDSSTQEYDSCPNCDLNLAMGVTKCQRCGWTPRDEIEADQKSGSDPSSTA